MPEAVIVEAVRSPVGKRNGTLSHMRPDDLAGLVLKALVDRAGIDPALVEDVIMGCVTPIGEQGFNIARLAAFIAGFPVEVCGVQINRMCGSSQQAAHFAAQAIETGDMDIVIAGGVESMSRVPMGSDGGTFSSRLMERFSLIPQGLSAELVADKWDISRREMEEFALESHRRAIEATDAGRFRREIVPIEVLMPDGSTVTFEDDEGPRRDTSLEKMAALPPAFKPDGKITAAVSSQISDGAAALLLMSRQKAEELGLRPRARFVARAVVGVDPVMMLHGVIPATRKVLARAGLGIEDMDVIEINEAFASVVLAWKKEIDPPDMTRVNPNGGACALGHPLGATGAILMTKLIHELERTGGRYGLQVMCIGHGMATASVIERLDG
ncbi:MAG TPA: steroid 3-ketoacyl-CoA thiolase [Clostridiales bacterium]|nr:steroid 3-ketoacyl-CoA thiolase [Clostridiales bacterium]